MVAELCAKTHYSFLRGASSPQQMVERACEQGYKALGIVDVNGVSGLPKAFEAARKKNLKMVTGVTLVLDEGSCEVLVLDQKAYGDLCEWLTHFHQKGANLKSMLQALGPVKGLRWILPVDVLFDYPLFRAYTLGRSFLGIDGWEPCSLRRQVQELSGLPCLATQRPLYHVREQKPLCDILYAIRHQTTLQDAGFLLESHSEAFLQSPEIILNRFQKIPGSIQEALKLAEEAQFHLGQLEYHYPKVCEDSQTELRMRVEQGLREKYPTKEIPKNVRAQVEHEMQLIKDLFFADYFLTVHDIVLFARSRDILCQGRGSAANSIICYVLGITAIDPVRMHLLFERFLSAERGEPPDIDVDFEHERREEVIQHIYETYGRDRAAMVAAVVTYQSRLADLEVAKVFGVKARHAAELRLKEMPPLACMWAPLLRDTPRHLSIHSGGFVLTQDKLTRKVPVQPASMQNRTIIQWDKYDLDILKFLKIDILALGMLSALKRMLVETGYRLDTVPSEDPQTYAMIRRADLIGVFQIESRAQMNMSPRLGAKTFYDLVIQVALVRPGPIVGQMVHPYLRRRQGLEPWIIPHPKLKGILERTLGVPLFQEQVQKIAITLGGFTPGESDELRRSMGTWKQQGIGVIGTRLWQGLIDAGLPHSFADDLFRYIQGFSAYGFPESHAASFALLTYVSCYLKCHHPRAFYRALLNAQPLGFYHPRTLITDAKRQGLVILPVDPNLSDWESLAEGIQGIRLGFMWVKGMSVQAYQCIEAARKKALFQSRMDFELRTHLHRDVLASLTVGGVFECFQKERRDVLWSQLKEHQLFDRTFPEQLNWLTIIDHKKPHHPFAAMEPTDLIRLDYQVFGLSTRGHWMDLVRQLRQDLKIPCLADVRQVRHKQRVQVVGVLTHLQRPPTAPKVVFGTLEDASGWLDLVLKRALWEECRYAFRTEPVWRLSGRMSKWQGTCSLEVDTCEVVSLSLS
jgi:error-prone DNA polymerase